MYYTNEEPHHLKTKWEFHRITSVSENTAPMTLSNVLPSRKFWITDTGKLKKRWKFLLIIFCLALCSAFGFGYYLIANDAPIIAGTITRNIEYKPGLMLDIYEPTIQKFDNAPVVVYIHGGAWMAGMKEG